MDDHPGFSILGEGAVQELSHRFPGDADGLAQMQMTDLLLVAQTVGKRRGDAQTLCELVHSEQQRKGADAGVDCVDGV